MISGKAGHMKATKQVSSLDENMHIYNIYIYIKSGYVLYTYIS